MGLRTLFIFGVVFITIPLAWRVPFYGLLTFSWLAYMRAQDLTWGIARTARLSYVVAAVMFLGWFVNERRRFTVMDIRIKLMLAMTLATFVSFAVAREQNVWIQNRLLEFVKIILIAVFTAGQLTTRYRVKALLWTIALSLGFFGVKGAIFGVLSGGSVIKQGPGGMLEDNNDFALEHDMNLPLLFYLGQAETNKWVRRGTITACCMSVIPILLTHSRGGFLAMCAVLGVFWWRSRQRIAGLALVGVVVVAFFLLVPDHVLERIGMISDYKGDSSAMGRLMAWGVARDMILDYPLLGVGIRNFRHHFTDYIDFEVSWSPVAHNSYLQIWAEGGTIAFVIYMALIVTTFWQLGKLRRLGMSIPGGNWIFNYARMIEACMAGFVVGAMFLNRGHFDLVYHLFAIVTGFAVVANQQARQPLGVTIDEFDMRPLEIKPHRGFRGSGAGPLRPTPTWGR